jgi:hypothetical protein
MCSPAVVELCHKFRDQLLGDPRAARGGIAPLLAALQRLAPSREHLTPIHADVLQLWVHTSTVCYVSLKAVYRSSTAAVDPKQY